MNEETKEKIAALNLLATRLGCPYESGESRTVTHPFIGEVTFKSGIFQHGYPAPWRDGLKVFGNYFAWEALGMMFGEWCCVCRSCPCVAQSLKISCEDAVNAFPLI